MEWLDHLGSWFLLLFIATMLFIVVGFLRFETTQGDGEPPELSIRELYSYSALSVGIGAGFAYWAYMDFLDGERSWHWVAMLAFFAAMQLLNGFYYARSAVRLRNSRL